MKNKVHYNKIFELVENEYWKDDKTQEIFEMYLRGVSTEDILEVMIDIIGPAEIDWNIWGPIMDCINELVCRELKVNEIA